MMVVALVATVVLNAIGLGLIALTNTEATIASNYRESSQMLYAAEAAAECAVSDILRAASWSDVLTGVSPSTFRDGTLAPMLPSQERLDLAALTASLQASSDADARRGANNPKWRLFLYDPLSAIVGSAESPEYVVAWVADDPAETDNDPLMDSNDKVTVRAQAFGRQGTQRTIDVTIAKASIGVSILSWREVR